MRNQIKKRPVNREPARPCILCRSDHFQTILVKNGWHYLKCRDCGLVSLHPQPTPKDLKANYDDYLPVDATSIRQWRALVKPVIDISAELITTRLGHTGRLLDVGCGYGFFMERMQQLGWLVEGIEVSPVGRRHALQLCGFEVYAHPLEELNLDENRYDAVTLFYVIEHVNDPVDILKKVKKILKPGGMVM